MSSVSPDGVRLHGVDAPSAPSASAVGVSPSPLVASPNPYNHAMEEERSQHRDEEFIAEPSRSEGWPAGVPQFAPSPPRPSVPLPAAAATASGAAVVGVKPQPAASALRSGWLWLLALSGLLLGVVALSLTLRLRSSVS